jgi:hypothetical protein
MLDKLVEFAKKNYPEFALFGSDEKIRIFFEALKNTTLIRFDEKGDIDGFFIYTQRGEEKIFFAACLRGNRQENVRDMRKLLRNLRRPIVILLRKNKKCLWLR